MRKKYEEDSFKNLMIILKLFYEKIWILQVMENLRLINKKI